MKYLEIYLSTLFDYLSLFFKTELFIWFCVEKCREGKG